mgnify:CR=1 FL=1
MVPLGCFKKSIYVDDGAFLFESREDLEKGANLIFSHFKQFGLTMEIINKLNKEVTILHPGPINRGVEITSEIADSSRSLILNQVENGVAVRMAVMYLLASKLK